MQLNQSQYRLQLPALTSCSNRRIPASLLCCIHPLLSPYCLIRFFTAEYLDSQASYSPSAAIFIINISKFNDYYLLFNSRSAIILSAATILVYIFGTIRETDRLKITKTREHLRKISKEHYRLKRISSAQLEINRELEERVSRQQATITTLYNQMHKMDSLNLGNHSTS